MERLNSKLLAGALGVALAVGLAVWNSNRRQAAPGAPVPTVPTTPSPANTNSSSNPRQEDRLGEVLGRTQAALAAAQDAQSKRQQLAALRQALSSSRTNEASAALRRFLDLRKDTTTGQGFKIGAHGGLEEAPTLRVWLLDYLGQIDPGAGAAYARTILSSRDSPDEWAVALRNLAQGDSSADAHELLQQKVGELLAYETWQKDPSVGYLESFDVAVYLGGTKLVPALSELVRKQDNPAIAHAAFLTLDRLVINDPSALLAMLQSNPGLMEGREATRADYFARADLRDPQQREVLESYLLDSRIGPAERAQFAGVFPNANFMISQNLLTPTPTPDRSTLVSRDAESLRVVQQWLSDSRFANLRPELEKAKSRLEEFVRQAGGR